MIQVCVNDLIAIIPKTRTFCLWGLCDISYRPTLFPFTFRLLKGIGVPFPLEEFQQPFLLMYSTVSLIFYRLVPVER
jgi:hypothetical protein